MKKPVNYFIVFLTLAMWSCRSRKDPHLVAFDYDYERDLTTEEYENGGTVQSHIMERRKNDTLFIDLIFGSSGCVQWDGDIRFVEDTLYLYHWQTNDIACDELKVYKLSYQVSVKDTIRYALKRVGIQKNR